MTFELLKFVQVQAHTGSELDLIESDHVESKRFSIEWLTFGDPQDIEHPDGRYVPLVSKVLDKIGIRSVNLVLQ